jgi:transposase
MLSEAGASSSRCCPARPHLKHFRRIATRYDKLARNYLSGVALATALAFWT